MRVRPDQGESPDQIRARVRLRPKAQLTLPDEVRRALRVREGDEVEFAVHADGKVTVRGYVSVPADQFWHLTSQQQDGPAQAPPPQCH